jgi:hypothetical protein
VFIHPEERGKSSPFFRVNKHVFIHPEERAKSSPETSVNIKNMTPGNNPEASIHNNHGESLQTHFIKCLFVAEDTYVVRSNRFWTDREMTLLVQE